MNKNNENWGAATSIFMTYMKGRGPNGKITQDAIENISERFGQVERDDRAEVYMKFTALLDSTGVGYSPRDFNY
jgi:hypothetical protein